MNADTEGGCQLSCIIFTIVAIFLAVCFIGYSIILQLQLLTFITSFATLFGLVSSETRAIARIHPIGVPHLRRGSPPPAYFTTKVCFAVFSKYHSLGGGILEKGKTEATPQCAIFISKGFTSARSTWIRARD